jgi:Lon-like ATP-dependent protease
VLLFVQIPAAEKQTGVSSSQLRLEDSAILALNRGYCREAGVRNLQKHVEQIYRKGAYQIVVKGVEQAAREADEETRAGLKKKGINPDAVASSSSSPTSTSASSSATASSTPSSSDATTTSASTSSDASSSSPSPSLSSSPSSSACIVVTEENLHKFVGSATFTSERMYDQLLPGVTTGLAWTSMGGSTLYTECVIADAHAAHGSIKASGHLKDVYVPTSCLCFTTHDLFSP